MRRTVATRIAESLGIGGEALIGHLLGHSNSSVTAIYNRYGYLKEIRAALEGAPQSMAYRKLLANHYAALAETQIKLGELGPAAASAEKLPEIFPRDGAQYRRAAELLGHCFSLAQSVKSADFDAARCARQAMKLLEAAAAAGSLDKRALESHALEGLRGEPGFQELEKSLTR